MEIDAQAIKKAKIDKKSKALIGQPNQILQVTMIQRNNNIYLIVMKANKILEVIENFQVTIYAE